MPFQWEFRPPARNAAAMLALAKPLAEEAGAHVLLDKSQPLVPVRSGVLIASGQVVTDGEGAAVVYTATNPRDGYDYAIKQHEDTSLNHPNGGQAKYLEQPMNTEHAAVGEAMAETVRKLMA